MKNGKEADESFIQIYQQLLIPFPILFNGPIIWLSSISYSERFNSYNEINLYKGKSNPKSSLFTSGMQSNQNRICISYKALHLW